MNNIINLQSVKDKKQAVSFANKIVNESLNDTDSLHTDGLSMILMYVEKIVFISGDEDETRKIIVCDPCQLLHAASSQIYTFSFHNTFYRFDFDGGYTYDLYLNTSICPKILDRFNKVLDMEQKLNINTLEVRLLKLKAYLDKL